MDDKRKFAYRNLLYRAMLDIRPIQWIVSRGWSAWNPVHWRQQSRRVQWAGAIADWLHNLAVYSAHNFEGFREELFWEHFESLRPQYPEFRLENYREEFDRHTGSGISRVIVSPQLALFIAQKIATYASEATESYQVLESPAVAEFGALPLIRHWCETIGLRPNGEVVRWHTDGDDPYSGARPVESRAMRLQALVEGSSKYPELQDLLPKRPPDSIDCKCRNIPIIVEKGVLCPHCGNLGWLPPSGAAPSDDQRRQLSELMHVAFVELRGIHGHPEQVHALAYAMHNLPVTMYGSGSWSWDATRTVLARYREEYPDDGPDYAAMIDAIRWND